MEAAKLREELAAEKTKTMEEMIKRLEAEKVAIEAANTALQVTTDAAKADAAKAEAARVAAEEAAASGGSISGGSHRMCDFAQQPQPLQNATLAGTATLAPAIASCEALHTLNLGSCRVGDVGGQGRRGR